MGNIKFIWKEFECPRCKRHVTVKKMKELENVREKQIGSGIGGKIAFVICGVLLVVTVALIKRHL